jgi:alkenylglycerophosphocholine/alkenylglycerophosphoethanolamine hydrolase
MIAFLLLLLVFIAAVTDWVAFVRGWKKVEYIAKPATLALLFLWLVVVSRLQGALLWFGLGVLLSLAGDIFLMFSDRWFIPGLFAFLLAQLMYIVGFNSPLPQVAPMWTLGLAIVLALTSALVLRNVTAGLATKGLRRLIAPVLLYGMVTTLMLLSAMLTIFRLEWNIGSSFLATFGAVFFYFSDVVLAWNKYVAPVKNGRMINIVAYHLGQIALIVGVAFQFTK